MVRLNSCHLSHPQREEFKEPLCKRTLSLSLEGCLACSKGWGTTWGLPRNKDTPSLYTDVASETLSELEHLGVLSESLSGNYLSIENIKIKGMRECKSVVISWVFRLKTCLWKRFRHTNLQKKSPWSCFLELKEISKHCLYVCIYIYIWVLI